MAGRPTAPIALQVKEASMDRKAQHDVLIIGKVAPASDDACSCQDIQGNIDHDNEPRSARSTKDSISHAGVDSSWETMARGASVEFKVSVQATHS
jgi:hypothetical protein